MRIPAALLLTRSTNAYDDPVPFKERLPLKLKAKVSGKGDNTTEVCCIYEMSVMFACFKENDFNQSLCNKEIENFQKCYMHNLTTKADKKEREARGILIPGDKKLSSKQINTLLKMYPSNK